jgi:glycerol uptake facilitator-like aquaporin
VDVRECTAEATGFFRLAFAGCGNAVMASAFRGIGIGLLGVSLAFRLTVRILLQSRRVHAARVHSESRHVSILRWVPL